MRKNPTRLSYAIPLPKKKNFTESCTKSREGAETLENTMGGLAAGDTRLAVITGPPPLPRPPCGAIMMQELLTHEAGVQNVLRTARIHKSPR
ncbi:hypothetical protein E2C01_094760 [Portunus trituberculatus]|uniref:Uncharacterized protein n=1 Tax=Portunus trituberculatus TaxID=210409 RepID=A0A5B7JN07_PORTR|nr:hypothetical protein [Portunus trituberculatus]